MERILADKTQKVSVNPLNPRHPRFINPGTDYENRSSGRNGNQSPVVYVDGLDNNTMRLRANKLVPASRRLPKKRLASMLADAPGANPTPKKSMGVVHVAVSDALKR